MKLFGDFWLLSICKGIFGWCMAWATRATVSLIHGTWFTELVVVLFLLELVLFRLGHWILSIAVKVSSTIPYHCVIIAVYARLYRAHIRNIKN